MEGSTKISKSEVSRYFLNGGKEGLHLIKAHSPFEVIHYDVMPKEGFVVCAGLDANLLVNCGAATKVDLGDTLEFDIPNDVTVSVKKIGTKTVTPKDAKPYEKAIWEYKVV